MLNPKRFRKSRLTQYWIMPSGLESEAYYVRLASNGPGMLWSRRLRSHCEAEDYLRGLLDIASALPDKSAWEHGGRAREDGMSPWVCAPAMEPR